MQIVGERFTDTSVTVPNAIATFPDYPAEIRAPVGTIAGVSAFQVHFGSQTVLTPGDEPDALVAMNPAALAVHLYDLAEGGLLIVNSAAFTEENLPWPASKPIRSTTRKFEEKIRGHRARHHRPDRRGAQGQPDHPARKAAHQEFLRPRLHCTGFTAARSSRPSTSSSPSGPAKHPDLADANIRVLKAGYFLGETTETTRNRYMVARAEVEAGHLSQGLRQRGHRPRPDRRRREKAGREMLFLGLSDHPGLLGARSPREFQALRRQTVQAEDEIAAIGVALGASFAGQIGVTATSGPACA
jgi:2-oxoglutarate/2-oxoacid ferredoxin oxidoreductase subunit alpha